MCVTDMTALRRNHQVFKKKKIKSKFKPRLSSCNASELISSREPFIPGVQFCNFMVFFANEYHVYDGRVKYLFYLRQYLYKWQKHLKLMWQIFI